MKNLIVYICCFILLFISFDIAAQQKGNKNPFQMVKVPDSVRYRLGLYLKAHDKLDTVYKAIYIYNSINNKDYNYKDGIYYFRLMSPHATGRLFINYKGEIKIFESIYVNDLLQDYLDYLKTTILPVSLRIKYLNVISRFLQQQYKTENS